MFSKIVLALSLLAGVVAIAATTMWIWFLTDWSRGGIDAWAALAFTMMATPASAGVLLLAVVPSCVLFFRGKERRDRVSFWLAACAFSLLLVEIIAIWLIPSRGE